MRTVTTVSNASKLEYIPIDKHDNENCVLAFYGIVKEKKNRKCIYEFHLVSFNIHENRFVWISI